MIEPLLLITLCAFGQVVASGNKEYDFTLQDMDKVVKGTQDVSKGIKKLSENYIVKNAKKANELLASIRTEIESNKFIFIEKSDRDRVNSFLAGLKKAEDFYTSVTSEKNVAKTKESLLSYYIEVQNFSVNVQKMLRDTENELKQLNKDYEALNRDIAKKGSSRESEKQIDSLERQIRFTEQRVEMLTNFSPSYEGLMPAISKIEEDIDFFILTLRESAKVFNSAYRTVELSKNILNAYDVIEELNNLNSLSDDIQKSWEDLEAIVDNLVEMASSIN